MEMIFAPTRSITVLSFFSNMRIDLSYLYLYLPMNIYQNYYTRDINNNHYQISLYIHEFKNILGTRFRNVQLRILQIRVFDSV